MLELDLGIWSLSRLFASKPDWKIQYAKSSRIEEKLRETNHPLPKPEQTAENLLQSVWIHTRTAIVALKRNQTFKAETAINTIRSSTIQLICEAQGIAYDFDRKIEEVDDPLVSRLRASVPTGKETHFLNALEEACNVALEAIARSGIDVSDARVYIRRLLSFPG